MAVTQPGQIAQNGQQMRQVSHATEEGAENMNRQALLTQGQTRGTAANPMTLNPTAVNPLAANPSARAADNNVPASATIRQFPEGPGSAAYPATDNQYIGTMSVTGNGHWGSRDDIPEHVVQGISQIQETSQSTQFDPIAQPPLLPPLLENGNVPFGQSNMPPPAFGQMSGEPRDAFTMQLDGNHSPPDIAGNPYQDHVPNLSLGGESNGMIPFQPPLQPPGPMPPADTTGHWDNQAVGNPSAGNPPANGTQGQIRMSLGNMQSARDQADIPPGMTRENATPMTRENATPAMSPMLSPAEPQAQIAIPEERIARNDAVQNRVPIDVRNDGATLQLGNTRNGNDGPQDGAQDNREGTGLPGSGELAGAQVPNLVIEKIMPQEVQINEPMTVVISIRNTGSSKAKNVVLTDRLPKGARFEEANASGFRTANGEVCWQLGDLGINEERNVELTLTPTAEGEIGSVATATFSVEASGSTRVTKPALTMEVTTASDEHLVGGDLILEIQIANPGTGIARNITLEEYVPDGLSHPTGKKLSSTLGDLKPNETKRLRLTLKCERAGETINYIVAKGENELFAESKNPILVLAPGLNLAIDGPKNRYLDRKATYELRVGNPGSATTREVLLFAKLPKGLDFVSTDSMGAYDPETHTVHWMLDALPAQQSGKIELVTLPRSIGECKIEFSGRAQGNLQASAAHEVFVDGIASLGFEIINKVDPVELGREASYEIRIFNRGTKASSNVNIRVQLPDDMRFIAAEGPAQYNISGSIVDFVNLHQLMPGEVKTYLIRAQCLAAGDQRVLVQVQSDEMEKPVTKEENTNVYGDE